jgi:hypothetical protein
MLITIDTILCSDDKVEKEKVRRNSPANSSGGYGSIESFDYQYDSWPWFCSLNLCSLNLIVLLESEPEKKNLEIPMILQAEERPFKRCLTTYRTASISPPSNKLQGSPGVLILNAFTRHHCRMDLTTKSIILA